MTKGSLLIDGVFCKLSQEGMCMDSKCKKPEVKKFIASRKSLYDGDE